MRSRKGKFLILLSIIACLFSLAACSSQDVDMGAFDCYTFDSRGNMILGFKNEENNNWYLFVPSDQDIAETVLGFSGETVKTVSCGEVNHEEGVIAHAFSKAGDSVELKLSNNAKITVIVMQSKLPSVQIILNKTDLETIHLDKNEKYGGNTVIITDAIGEDSLIAVDSVEVKGRGNSTWTFFEKKAYQIKFEEKTSVLEMGAAKKWVLLANATDDSMMRNSLTYRAAYQMNMDFVPDMKYVDLWIDGDYRGTYLIGEKVEIGDNRLELQDSKGVLLEHDEGFYAEEDYWFLSDYTQRHFALKESVTDASEDEKTVLVATKEFETAVDRLMEYLYSTPSDLITIEKLSEMIDVDSFIRYYLVNEYVMNREGFVSSFYWYKDGTEDVIHLGPVWDFDSCMGVDGAANTGSAGEDHIIFRYLLAAPEVYQRTEELKNNYWPLLTGMAEDVDVLYEEIAKSAEMNYIRWDVLGTENPKTSLVAYSATYPEAVSTLKTWLKGREEAFTVPKLHTITGKVDSDAKEMVVRYCDGQEYDSVQFAVWTLNNDQDDMQWYAAELNETGEWTCKVDLGRHNDGGLCRIDAYNAGTNELIASGKNYLPEGEKQTFGVDVEIVPDENKVLISMTETDLCTNVYFAVWSKENGQDDLQWYKATRDRDGVWSYSADLAAFPDAGEYYIHVYDIGAENIMLCNTKVVVNNTA